MAVISVVSKAEPVVDRTLVFGATLSVSILLYICSINELRIVVDIYLRI